MISVNKILVIQTAFIGDAILASSMLESLHKEHPGAEIHFLVRKGNEGLFKEHPFLKRLWVWDKKADKYAGLFRIMRMVRKEKFELVVNAHRHFNSGIITYYSKAIYKSGFTSNPFASSYTHKIEHRLDGSHETERNHALLNAFVENKMPEPPRLYPSKEDALVVEPYTQGKYRCIAPASVWFTKAWPVEKWVELIDLISADERIYLLGGPDDAWLCQQIQGKTKHSNVEVLAGKLSLLQSAALMKGAVMNYVNDSSPMHLASAVNAPTTAIYCSTVPKFGFGPLSDDKTIVETPEDLDCRPCGLHGHKTCPKRHFKCAIDIEASSIA